MAHSESEINGESNCRTQLYGYKERNIQIWQPAVTHAGKVKYNIKLQPVLMLMCSYFYKCSFPHTSSREQNRWIMGERCNHACLADISGVESNSQNCGNKRLTTQKRNDSMMLQINRNKLCKQLELWAKACLLPKRQKRAGKPPPTVTAGGKFHRCY